MALSIKQHFSTFVWKAWLACPDAVKKFFRSNPMLKRLKEGVADTARTHVDHNLFYDRTYFQDIEEWSVAGANAMAESIHRDFRPHSVVDVGCGSGVLLAAVARHGIATKGLEYSDAGLEMCRSRGLEVIKFDIEQGCRCTLRAELVVSTEVAEHLPEACADAFVDLLCQISDQVIFTAATPGQGGDDHVNEQPHTYWIEKFGQRGYLLDVETTEKWKQEWSHKDVASWYRANLMIFRHERA